MQAAGRAPPLPEDSWGAMHAAAAGWLGVKSTTVDASLFRLAGSWAAPAWEWCFIHVFGKFRRDLVEDAHCMPDGDCLDLLTPTKHQAEFALRPFTLQNCRTATARAHIAWPSSECLPDILSNSNVWNQSQACMPAMRCARMQRVQAPRLWRRPLPQPCPPGVVDRIQCQTDAKLHQSLWTIPRSQVMRHVW